MYPPHCVWFLSVRILLRGVNACVHEDDWAVVSIVFLLTLSDVDICQCGNSNFLKSAGKSSFLEETAEMVLFFKHSVKFFDKIG